MIRPRHRTTASSMTTTSRRNACRCDRSLHRRSSSTAPPTPCSRSLTARRWPPRSPARGCWRSMAPGTVSTRPTGKSSPTRSWRTHARARDQAANRPLRLTRCEHGAMAHVGVSNLAYAHPGGDLLFSDVSFRVSPGQHVGLVGTNGVGKSTLLKILAGELAPDEGEYAVGGLARLHAAGRGRERRRRRPSGRCCCRWRHGPSAMPARACSRSRPSSRPGIRRRG